MDLALICLAAFAAAGLTLFSGFGLGTILMPVIAIFLPVPVAIAVTAVVHFLNTLFKLALLWRHVSARIFISFGLPALLAAIPGALLLGYLSELQPVASHQLAGHEFEILPVKLAAGLLLIVFASAELFPFLDKMTSHIGLPAGGILSGFFGGLSGHQGAFRSAFLVNAGLNKESFVATNAAIAALIDITRLTIYGLTFSVPFVEGQGMLVASAALSAFLGVFLATRLLRKVTFQFIRRIVALMLYALGIALSAGLI